MSYLEDTIDWQTIELVDFWLDYSLPSAYQQQPMAQDWARISKIGEELGEAISEFVGITGQNPRKGIHGSQDAMLNELADVMLTAIMAIQHFTKSSSVTREVLRAKQRRVYERMVKARESASDS